MSEEENKKIIKLFPNECDLEEIRELTREQKDKILLQRRDEMLEFLDAMRGRVMAMDVRAIVCIALASEPSNDTTYASDEAGVDLARTVGCIEFLKHDLIRERIEEFEG